MAGSDGGRHRSPRARRSRPLRESRRAASRSRARRRSSQRWRTGSVNAPTRPSSSPPLAGRKAFAATPAAYAQPTAKRGTASRGYAAASTLRHASARKTSVASCSASASAESGRRARGCARRRRRDRRRCREWNQVVAPSTPAREMPAGSSVISPWTPSRRSSRACSGWLTGHVMTISAIARSAESAFFVEQCLVDRDRLDMLVGEATQETTQLPGVSDRVHTPHGMRRGRVEHAPATRTDRKSASTEVRLDRPDHLRRDALVSSLRSSMSSVSSLVRRAARRVAVADATSDDLPPIPVWAVGLPSSGDGPRASRRRAERQLRRARTGRSRLPTGPESVPRAMRDEEQGLPAGEGLDASCRPTGTECSCALSALDRVRDREPHEHDESPAAMSRTKWLAVPRRRNPWRVERRPRRRRTAKCAVVARGRCRRRRSSRCAGWGRPRTGSSARAAAARDRLRLLGDRVDQAEFEHPRRRDREERRGRRSLRNEERVAEG